ncbi:hypothetical protein [Streptomyces orinoci]|uniref:hypothetical protein n=1 Tax=Streptomyces orinoci TaxID=67339 RepID=UPI00240E2866|nr:hypothetical protein [Streptomyces orinoci]
MRIIDKSPSFHRTSRAKGPNQRSREILADLGVGEELARGRQHPHGAAQIPRRQRPARRRRQRRPPGRPGRALPDRPVHTAVEGRGDPARPARAQGIRSNSAASWPGWPRTGSG